MPYSVRKGFAFPQASFMHGGSASGSSEAKPPIRLKSTGKAKPFRTECGKAATLDNEVLLAAVAHEKIQGRYKLRFQGSYR